MTAVAIERKTKERSRMNSIAIAMTASAIVILLPIIFLSEFPRNMRSILGFRQRAQSDRTDMNSFAVDLFVNLINREDPEEENVIISPLSVASALSMVAMGATKKSRAARELKARLGGSYLDVPATPSLTVANSAWITSDVLRSYSRTVKEDFGADVFKLPPDARPVNEWVAGATSDKIQTLLSDDDISDNTVGLLINAVFFKASWLTAFDPRHTLSDAPFYNRDPRDLGEQVGTVSMMSLQNKKFPYGKFPISPKRNDDTVTVVELPYSDATFSAVIVVPDRKTTIADILERLTPETWNNWMEGCEERAIGIFLPRFKLEYGVKSLKPVLKESLGIAAAFDSSPSDPQLLKLSSDPRLYLDDILHKASLEVTEEGTVAAAATAAVVMARSAPIYPRINVNRPFLFAIRDRKTGGIVFMAKIGMPKE